MIYLKSQETIIFCCLCNTFKFHKEFKQTNLGGSVFPSMLRLCTCQHFWGFCGRTRRSHVRITSQQSSTFGRRLRPASNSLSLNGDFYVFFLEDFFSKRTKRIICVYIYILFCVCSKKQRLKECEFCVFEGLLFVANGKNGW